MKTVDLIKALYSYHTRFADLSLLLKDDSAKLKVSTTLSYKSLVFKIERNELLYVQITYSYDDKASALTNFHSEDSKAEALLTPHLQALISPIIESSSNSIFDKPLSSIIINYLEIAESIARQSYLCASGDDYTPGYFSKIVLSDQGILLEQINHKNSRSLAHKHDYSLRELTFFIPYDSQTPAKHRFDEEYIGVMSIQFSDRSSANNKNCGDKIQLQIDLEKQKFSI